MNVEYRDGRRELLTALNPQQVADHAERITSDPEFERAEIMRQKEMDIAMNGETNRHARRKFSALLRKKGNQ